MALMQPLNLPSLDLEIVEKGGEKVVFDPIRKKHLLLTPEEWVRQHFVQYLINQHGYAKSLIKLEGGLSYNKLRKRTDILVYNRRGEPFMLVECKAAHIPLNQKVFQQASTYNKTIRAKYLVVTNGLSHYCCEINHDLNTFQFLEGFPGFDV